MRSDLMDEFISVSLPVGWHLCLLGEITTFSQYGISSSQGRDCSVPIIKMNNLQDGHLDLRSLDYIELSNPEKENLLLKNGDLLLNRTNSYDLVGKTAIYDIEGEYVFASYLVRFRLSSSVIPAFVNYYLNSDDGQRKLRRLATKAVSQANINPSILKRKLLIPIPPLPEQAAITNILSSWDHAIDLTTQLIEAKQQHKRGLMQQLLTGKKRFAQFNEPWKMVRIGDLLSESRIEGSNGRTAHKITVRLYGKGVQPKEEKSLGSEATKYYRRYAGQFIYSKLDFLNGAFGIIPTEMDGYESTLDLPCFDFQGSVLPKFFLYFVSREHFYSKFASAAIGGRKARRIQIEEFLSTEIELPNLDEQKCIAQVLDAGDQELALLNRKLALLKKQKQGLMQQLLTGKVRVKL